ncbi:MAG: RNA polymerase sigma factor [Alphaproteobacteria bacterium]|nr:RNA polymerase sigma factor [Alphaproteobacteria bacterium]
MLTCLQVCVGGEARRAMTQGLFINDFFHYFTGHSSLPRSEIRKNMKRRLKLVTVEGKIPSRDAEGGGKHSPDSWQGEDQRDFGNQYYHDKITTLYQEYNETLVRYLTIRLRSRQDAVEVAQEAYIRLIKRENLAEIDCFQSFLFRTATNLSIDLQRQRTRHARNFARSKILMNGIEEITPERALDARQALVELREILKKLPPKCREAFMLYKFKNLSHGEIAERMDLSISSIRKYIARGLAVCIREMNG